MSEMKKNIDPIEVLSSDNAVYLRQLTVSDAQAYFDLIDADRSHYSQFDDGVSDRYQTVADVKEMIGNIKPNRYRFGVWENNRMVGGIALEDCEDDSAEVGFWIGAEHTGNGYASSALKALSLFGFGSLGKKVLFANVLIGNDASRAVLENSGFKYAEDDDGHWVFKLKRGINGG